MKAEGDGGIKLALVLGGTGKTGRRVVSRLEERGLPVRIGSRRASRPSTGRRRAAGLQH
jgi:uncharacterized protein YbjT (DUF2867 family)